MRSDGDSVVFESETLGEITVKWTKIQDLQSEQKFAVIEKEMDLRKSEDPAKIPQGSLSVSGESLVIRDPAGHQRTFPIAATDHVVDQTSFAEAVRRRAGIFEAWRGGFTAGISVVQATQSNQAYTSAINLMRAVPRESWLESRHRTIVHFNMSYGTLTQPNSPELRTEILHADAEHDIYLSRRLYTFIQTAFDHNFSQGLDLAQNYGGGIGFTALKTEFSELDLKASIGYLKQQFTDSAQNQNLIGSIFAQNYTHRFPHGMSLVQRLTVAPAWNNLNAYSGTGDVTLTFPVYQRLNFTIGVVNTFINNPSPGFRKNSFQATTGITYMLK